MVSRSSLYDKLEVNEVLFIKKYIWRVLGQFYGNDNNDKKIKRIRDTRPYSFFWISLALILCYKLRKL